MPPAIIAAIAGLIFTLNNKEPKQPVVRVGEADKLAFEMARIDYQELNPMKENKFTGRL